MASGGRSDEQWDFFISYTAADQQWAEWIAWELEADGFHVLIQAWDFVPGSNWTASMAEGLERSTRTIAVVSEAYLRSVYSQAEWNAAFRADPTGLTRRLLPVRVEDCDRPGLLGAVVAVDLFGRDDAEARRVLLEGVRAAIGGRAKPLAPPVFPVEGEVVLSEEMVAGSPPSRREGATSPYLIARTAPPHPAQRTTAPPRPSLEDLDLQAAAAVRRIRIWEVGEVFKPTGIPEVTFVQPAEFVTFGMSLRQPGLSVVLEGPSGIGKTTFLRHAIEQDSRRLKEPRILSARTEKDRAKIDRIIDGDEHSGIVAIDDFHRLSLDQKRRAVDYLKHLADTDDRERKLVIVGVPNTAQSLVEVSFDIANRIRVFSPEWATNDQVEELIRKGEQALNISFEDRAAIVRAAHGSLITAQVLCWHLLGIALIEETAPTHRTVRTGIAQARRRVTKELHLKYQRAVEAFAGLDGSDETACIELLVSLAATPDGVLTLDRFTHGGSSVAKRAARVLTDGVGEAMASDADIGRVLYYDALRRRLIADDPQFMYYLRQLDRTSLAADAGKRP